MLKELRQSAQSPAKNLGREQTTPPEIKIPPSPQQPAASEISSTPPKHQRACVSHRDVGGAPPPPGTRSGRTGGRPFCEAASEVLGCSGLREAVRAGAIGRWAEAFARGVTRVWVLVPRKLSPVRLPQPRNGRGCAGLEPPPWCPGAGPSQASEPAAASDLHKGVAPRLRGSWDAAHTLRPPRMREVEPACRSGDEAVVGTPRWS